MQKAGDHKNHHQEVPTSTSSDQEITGTTLLCSSQQQVCRHDQLEVRNYSEMVKVLSQVDLPSPSPALATSCTITGWDHQNLISRFHEAGQTSGTKRKAIDHIEQVNVERERELKSKQQHDYQQPDHPQRVATDINTTEKRRRHRISDRIRVLQALVPNCSNKRDKASILGNAIDYIKFLQMQLQVMMQYSMGIGIMSQGPYMFRPPGQPNLLQLPNFAPQFATSLPTQHGIPHYGFYLPTNFPLYFSGFPQLMPPMEAAGTGAHNPRPLLYPQQQQFPLETTFQSTTPSSGTIIPTTRSQVGSTLLAQPSYYMPPVTSQGTQ